MEIMTPNDKLLFEKHIELYEQIKRHSFCKNYSIEVYHDLVELYTRYVSKSHNFSHWCTSCRMELVEVLYNWYSANTNEVPEIIAVADPVVEKIHIETDLSDLKKHRKLKKK